MNPNPNHTKQTQIYEIDQLIQSLPKATLMGSNVEMLNYQGVWCLEDHVRGIFNLQKYFSAQDTDIVAVSPPKTGTTWLKSLLFSVVNRVHYPTKQSPLLSYNPHELVPHLEGVYGETYPSVPEPSQLYNHPRPRLLQTHLPYASLPESIKSSECRIVCIARNPLDTVVSQWHYYSKAIRKMNGDQAYEPPSIEDFFEDFCQGKTPGGSFFDLVLEYWKLSVDQPNKVLFLKYEDLKDNPVYHVKNLAKFVGIPFSRKEENEGVIEEIVELCSIGNLKELKFNKTGSNVIIENEAYFRKGEVGDWTNYFTPQMMERMVKLIEDKFAGSKLSFKLLP